MKRKAENWCPALRRWRVLSPWRNYRDEFEQKVTKIAKTNTCDLKSNQLRSDAIHSIFFCGFTLRPSCPSVQNSIAEPLFSTPQTGTFSDGVGWVQWDCLWPQERERWVFPDGGGGVASSVHRLRNPDVRGKWLASACSKRRRSDSLKAELQRRDPDSLKAELQRPVHRLSKLRRGKVATSRRSRAPASGTTLPGGRPGITNP